MELSQKDLARLLGVTPRQVRNLHDRGMPSSGEGRSRLYGPAAVQWYVEYKVGEERARHATGEREQLEVEFLRQRNREARVKADLAESRAVLVDDAAALFEEDLSIIRETLLQAPVRYADLVRPDDPAAGETALEEVIDDVLRTLQERLSGPDGLTDEGSP